MDTVVLPSYCYSCGFEHGHSESECFVIGQPETVEDMAMALLLRGSYEVRLHELRYAHADRIPILRALVKHLEAELNHATQRELW